jgi:hypothetical protein
VRWEARFNIGRRLEGWGREMRETERGVVPPSWADRGKEGEVWGVLGWV